MMRLIAAVWVLLAGGGSALGMGGDAPGGGGVAPGAGGEEHAGGFFVRTSGLGLHFQPEEATEKQNEGGSARPRKVFGEEGSTWLSFGGGVAYDFDDDTDYNLRGDISYFLARDVELAAELNGWYFDQSGPNAVGINPAVVFRWHFVHEGRFTAYVDAGIGLLFATDHVPDGGTTFDFTPRIGGGMTYALTEDLSGPRAQLGLRWHHISNARINGDDDNPSRDGLMVYTGVQFQF